MNLDHAAKLQLRERFTREEISDAFQEGGGYAGAAKILSATGRGLVTRQLARHWVMNLDGSEVAEDEHVAKHVMKTRNQQISNNQLRKDVRALTEYIENVELTRESIEHTVETLNHRRPVDFGVPSDPEGTPCTVELLLSDLQIGKLAKNYSTHTARARLFEYGRAALFQIHQKIDAGYNVERIVVGLLGDVIESDKKHKNSARATDTGTAEQMHNAMVALFELILEPLARFNVQVEVVCITGNHDHDDHGLMMYKPGLEQLSYPLYRSLEYITRRAGYSNVVFQIPEGSFGVVEFYGQYALYEHGVGVSVSEASMKSHKVKRSEQVQKHLTYFRMG